MTKLRIDRRSADSIQDIDSAQRYANDLEFRMDSRNGNTQAKIAENKRAISALKFRLLIATIFGILLAAVVLASGAVLILKGLF